MIELLFGKRSKESENREYVTNKKRFFTEFKSEGPPPISWSEKPEDFRFTFRGNKDDCFRIGVSVAKKTLKLYTDFYKADIIIASPLGLRMIVGAEDESSSEFDFLASIEILILDQTDVLLMQNWQQVIHVLEAVNKKPREQHATDYSRNYDQLIVELLCLAQAFQKFPCENPTEEAERRFVYFVERVLPQYVENSMRHTLIYVPSYYDYVRLRNYFKKGMIPTYDRFYFEFCNMVKESEESEPGLLPTCTVLLSKYDALRLSRIVGTQKSCSMIQSDTQTFMIVSKDK